MVLAAQIFQFATFEEIPISQEALPSSILSLFRTSAGLLLVLFFL
jgi:hypothetical protein